MTQRFQGGDIVVRRINPKGQRGMVLGYESDNLIMVSWQHGYDEWTYELEPDIEAIEVLDLMVEAFDGVETKFRYGYPQEQRPPRRR